MFGLLKFPSLPLKINDSLVDCSSLLYGKSLARLSDSCECVCAKILAQTYMCTGVCCSPTLSLCQCKLGSGRFFLQQFSGVPELWASPEQVGFQKAYGGISQIHGVKTWPNSDWPLSGSTLTFCSDQQRCNKLFRLCGRGLLKQNPLPPQPSAGRGREKGRKKGEESKREGGEKDSEEKQGEKGGIRLKRYCLVCVHCFGFFFHQCSLCWDLGFFCPACSLKSFQLNVFEQPRSL